MKKFVFDMEDILEFRQFEQQKAESELAKALAAEKEIQDKIDQLAMKQVTVQKQMKNSTNFYDIANANQFYQFVKNQTEYFLEEISKAKLVTDQKREVVRLAMQKTDALNALKDEQLKEYKKQLIKNDDEVTDEIVTSKA